LRANIADLLPRGGFPPVHLAEMNFDAFDRQRQALRERQSAAT
jgi:preprotein translocase subunit SecB